MKRTRKTDPVVFVLAAFLALVILLSSVLGFSFLKLKDADRMNEQELAKNAAEIAEKREQINGLTDQISDYEAQLAKREQDILSLKEEAEGLRTEISGLSETVSRLLDEKTTDSEILSEARSQHERLEQQLAEKEEELAKSESMLGNFRTLVNNNHGFRSEKITALFETLEYEVPWRAIYPETAPDESGEAAEDSIPVSAEPVAEPEYVPAKLAYFYKDLTTGYTISDNEKEIMYSASLIKAPYIYSVLLEIEEFEQRKYRYSSEGEPLYDEEGTPLFTGAHPNLTEDGSIHYLPGEEKYDLSRIWIYDPETMYEEGSGEIQYMEAGTEMTYRQLVEYALLYSDNVAFAQVKKVFGTDTFYRLVWELDIQGPKQGFMQLSAEDCAVFLEEIHRFFDTDSEYAFLMKDCMIRSKHTVMICAALPGKTVAHKYGWDLDAYHDMAIVLEDHPYILVIMTDLENGGWETNAFIQKVTKLTDDIHNSHYS